MARGMGTDKNAAQGISKIQVDEVEMPVLDQFKNSCMVTRGSSLHGKSKFNSSSSYVHLEKMWNKRDLFVPLPVEASVKKMKQHLLGQTERERKRQKERAQLYSIVAKIHGKEKKII